MITCGQVGLGGAGLLTEATKAFASMPPLVIDLVPFKHSSRNVLFPHRVLFTKPEMPCYMYSLREYGLGTSDDTMRKCAIKDLIQNQEVIAASNDLWHRPPLSQLIC